MAEILSQHLFSLFLNNALKYSIHFFVTVTILKIKGIKKGKKLFK